MSHFRPRILPLDFPELTKTVPLYLGSRTTNLIFDMSLSFAANSFQLANWGFSFGDVAVLAGAGRHVITWLTANFRDSALLDFLKVSDLLFRRGLVDPVALNKRWSQRVALLQNGRRIELEPEGSKKELENLTRFTWIMTIIVVCLDQVVTNNALREIIVAFTGALFESATLENEYLSHEIPEHIQGWRSVGATRMMVPRASDVWRELEKRKIHLPGCAPKTESEEIVRFLLWVVVNGPSTFRTASSDVYSLAILLSSIGFDCLRTDTGDFEVLDSLALVILDTSITPSVSTRTLEKRVGMRIPLINMEESVSLWPGTPAENNNRRLVFTRGQKAGASISLQIVSDSEPLRPPLYDPRFEVVALGSGGTAGREEIKVFSIATRYLLSANQEATHELIELIKSWHLQSEVERQQIISDLGDHPTSNHLGLGGPSKYRDDLQIFLLGYYYTVLSSILDTSRLKVKEGFGSWGWHDPDFLQHIEAFKESGVREDDSWKPKGDYYRTKDDSLRYSRSRVLQLAAYLFAGAEEHQIAALIPGTIGLHAKLTIVSSALFGGADTRDKIAKLCLLDLDPTAIPSDAMGVIKPATQPKPEVVRASKPPLDVPAAAAEFKDNFADFTSHIEPAWGYDPNLCLVTYRHHGRLVHKVNPCDIEAALLRYNRGAPDVTWPKNSVEPFECLKAISQYSRSQTDTVPIYQSRISDFYTVHGGTINLPQRPPGARYVRNESLPSSIYLVPAAGLVKARCCVAAMYTTLADSVLGDYRAWNGLPWEAIDRNALVLAVGSGEPAIGTVTVIVM